MYAPGLPIPRFLNDLFLDIFVRVNTLGGILLGQQFLKFFLLLIVLPSFLR